MYGLLSRRAGAVASVVIAATLIWTFSTSIPPVSPGIAAEEPPSQAMGCGGVFPGYASWSSQPSNHTRSVALGDIDRDGDLDLVCGNMGEPITVRLNNGGAFPVDPDWFSVDRDNTLAIALGDLDGDGYIDLVCGTGSYNKAYLNTGGFSIRSRAGSPPSTTARMISRSETSTGTDTSTSYAPTIIL
jgi:hypothetical protein